MKTVHQALREVRLILKEQFAEELKFLVGDTHPFYVHATKMDGCLPEDIRADIKTNSGNKIYLCRDYPLEGVMYYEVQGWIIQIENLNGKYHEKREIKVAPENLKEVLESLVDDN